MNLQVFYQWFEELSKHLSSMSRWQLKNLALFSLGVVLAENSQQMTIARKLLIITGIQRGTAATALPIKPEMGYRAIHGGMDTLGTDLP